MGQQFKKITAIFLCVLMIAGMFASTATASSGNGGLKKGEFIFAPHTYTDGDLTDIYYYTDEVFSGSAIDYNEHLATMSMILASASISSQEADAGYEIKSQNLSYLFREWDFTGFSVNDSYTEKPGEQTMGVGMAYKVIGEGENAYTLLAIVPESAGYEKEWAGNFTVGTEGVHEGFATGRDVILDFAKAYVAENADDFEGDVKVWTVGYSRGAGVANLIAAYLDDHGDALGVELKKENIFAYTFGEKGKHLRLYLRHSLHRSVRGRRGKGCSRKQLPEYPQQIFRIRYRNLRTLPKLEFYLLRYDESL